MPAEKVNPFDQPQAARLTGPEDAIAPSIREVTITQLVFFWG